MPLLTAREVEERWREGFYCGLVVGLVAMGTGAVVGAWVAVWWLAGG